jgi:hypothetical protein
VLRVPGEIASNRTDYVGILYRHGPAAHMLNDIEPLLRKLESLKSIGKVRYIGLSGGLRSRTDIVRTCPAAGEILQIQVPADARGLPDSASAAAPPAVRFREFPASAGSLAEALDRPGRSAPLGVILLLDVASGRAAGSSTVHRTV